MGHVSIDVMDKADIYLIRGVQKDKVNAEYTALLEGKPISNKSKLKLLNPFWMHIRC